MQFAVYVGESPTPGESDFDHDLDGSEVLDLVSTGIAAMEEDEQTFVLIRSYA